MSTIPKILPKKKVINDRIAIAKQQLELEYWLSRAMEAGCFSLECGS
jgi:hypothetical protein